MSTLVSFVHKSVDLVALDVSHHGFRNSFDHMEGEAAHATCGARACRVFPDVTCMRPGLGVYKKAKLSDSEDRHWSWCEGGFAEKTSLLPIAVFSVGSFKH